MIELTDSLKARIRAHEGVRTSMYLDSLGKATIGIGHLIQPHEREKFSEGVEISMELVEELFDLDLNRAAAGAEVLIEECVGHDLPEHITEVILEMVFQLGTQGVRNFKKMWKAMRVKDWQKAAAEMKDSRWHSQTTKRCEHLAEIVANTAKLA
jgi:GH24 family phage-related lysozyme (muramidase)